MDIVRAQRLGFNGARCHQKVFQPGSADFSHADALGFLCFAEYPDWPGGQSRRWSMGDEERYLSTMEREWPDTVDALHNHPSIIAWGMFNEMGPKNGWKFQNGPGGGFRNWGTPKKRKAAQEVYENLVVRVAKAIRSRDLQRRPIHDVSGWIHVPQSKPDVWSLHAYNQKPENLLKVLTEPHEKYVHGRAGQPLLVAEYGGVGLEDGGPLRQNPGGGQHGGPVGANGKNPPSFKIGYDGTPGLPKSAAAALQRIDDLTASIYSVESVAGFCYTQLYDVEYEKNGLLRYDRSAKRGLPLAALRKIF
ncbi:unnamed protein product [Prorocentrum cordatum]|uniref:Beta-galactosidase n=1 Tax=Prorocentrum cordatum TaxID=2364126 RepID=A0ABN9TXI4_9DINO|nr:unnamed protein product [Polarella glacialis]